MQYIRWSCEAPQWEHTTPNGLDDGIPTGGNCRTYQEAKRKARAHFKATGHLARAEKTITELFGLEHTPEH